MNLENFLVGFFLSFSYYLNKSFFSNFDLKLFYSKKYINLLNKISQNRDIKFLQKKLYIQQLKKQFFISILQDFSIEVIRFFPIIITFILSLIYISKVKLDYTNDEGLIINLINIILLNLIFDYYFKEKFKNFIFRFFIITIFSLSIFFFFKLNFLIVMYIFFVGYVHPLIYSKFNK